MTLGNSTAVARIVMSWLTVLGALTYSTAWPAQLAFQWDYQDPAAVGFVLYCGQSTGQYQTRTDVGAVKSYTILSVPEGTAYFCAITAYDSSKVESAYSNEVSGIVPSSTSPKVKHSRRRA